MQYPLISVITVTFNRIKYLEKTILSVQNQDYPCLEHIIIDGGSTDGTVDLLKSYDGQYNMRWSSEKDEGISDGLNKGFKMAKGSIFCWLDSDDVYLQGTIKKIVDVFQKRPEIDLVFGDILIINSDDEKINNIKFTDFSFENWIYEGGCINPSAAFWRKELHKKIGGLDKKYMWSPDIYFFTEAGACGAKFYHINRPLAAYRYHSDQILGNQNCLREKKDIFKIKKKDYEDIKRQYIDSSLNKSQMMWKKTKILLRRVLGYIKQGDLCYVLRGIFKKLRFFKYEA